LRELVREAKANERAFAARVRTVLRSDFFDMPTYPEITFTSTAVEHGGGDSYRGDR
jgi:polyisoprenoid-binding protein YceI